MFIGEYIHSVDDKGRVIMPQKFREQLSQKFYITKGLDGCLSVYSEDEWMKLADKANALSPTKELDRRFTRYTFGSARDVEVDKQGRIIIPQLLRDYAKIGKEVAILGVSTKIEIWSKEIYDKYVSIETANYDKWMNDFEDIDL